MFLVKYDPNGNVMWVRTPVLPGSGCSAQGTFVALDPSGNAYVTGVFNDSLFFGSTLLTNGGPNGNAFIVKYNPNGNPMWAESPACPSGNAIGTCISSDAAGNIYATGNYTTSTALSFGAVNLGNGTTRNMFLSKFDNNGNVIWANNASIQGNLSSISNVPGLGEYLRTDAAGNVYLTGNYTGTIAFGTQTVTGGINSSYGNVFLAKFSATGSPIWARSGILSNSTDFATDYSISTDKWSNIYLSGESYGGLTFGGILLQSAGSGAASFLVKIDSSGNTLCGSTVNNQNNISQAVNVSGHNAVSADPKSPNAYFTGSVQGYNQCRFGSETINGIGEIYGFLGKWTCGTCTVAPSITAASSVCQGQSITLVAGGGKSYLWNTGTAKDSLTFIPAASGTVYVAITNDSCTLKDSVSLTVHPVPVPTINSTQTTCEGTSVQLKATGGAFYSWNPSTGLTSTNISDPEATPLQTTTYSLVVSNGYCQATDTTQVIVNPVPSIQACCDTTLYPGHSMQLNSSGTGTYSWSPSAGLNCTACDNPIASPEATTVYTLTISSNKGCISTAHITIEVNCGDVFIPTAFSPNGDGQNDQLFVRGLCIQSLYFAIFNRWGEKVFEAIDKSNGWDGKYKGKECNSAVYMYYLKATLFDGTAISKQGNVTLLR